MLLWFLKVFSVIKMSLCIYLIDTEEVLTNFYLLLALKMFLGNDYAVDLHKHALSS